MSASRAAARGNACLQVAGRVQLLQGGNQQPAVIRCGRPPRLQRHCCARPRRPPRLPQEPQFFTERGGCLHGNATVPWACNRDLSMDYIVNTLKRDVAAASGLQKAAFEASADYAGVRAGRRAGGIVAGGECWC